MVEADLHNETNVHITLDGIVNETFEEPSPAVAESRHLLATNNSWSQETSLTGVGNYGALNTARISEKPISMQF